MSGIKTKHEEVYKPKQINMHVKEIHVQEGDHDYYGQEQQAGLDLL